MPAASAPISTERPAAANNADKAVAGDFVPCGSKDDVTRDQENQDKDAGNDPMRILIDRICVHQRLSVASPTFDEPQINAD